MIANVFLLIGCFTFGAYAYPNLESRIVGGQQTDVKNIPYQASVQYLSQHMCGGTIISTNHILTAAHCVENMNQAFLSVRIGSTDHATGGKVINVADVKSHTEYEPGSFNNDVAVLTLAVELEFTANIYSIPMANKGDVYKVGDNAMISGWGSLAENQPFKPDLHSALVPIISQDKCRQIYGEDRITDQMLCAGSDSFNACKGDYGGPLMLNNKVIGIISWGIGCTIPGLNAVYTDVGTVRDFIDTVLKE